MRIKPGPLEPEDSIKVLARIWGRDREGYVFLPYIPGNAPDYDARRNNYHEGPAFEWPKDETRILEHIQAHRKDDVYFSPSLFVDDRRVERFAESERALWADLDEADARQVDDDYKPTIAWESSPGRFQAIWLLAEPRVGASWPGDINHRLTVTLGADPSGWDTTQLLRVPGRPNYKPDKRKGSTGAPGQLLWSDGPMYSAEDFDDLPPVPARELADGDDLLDDELLAGIDRHAVWARVRLKVSSGVRELMAAKHIEGSDRSESLWRIERDLADAGCSLAEIVAVVRGSIWNKYAGRADELKRLKIEAAKALGSVGEAVTTLEDAVTAKPSPMRFSTLFLAPHPRPRWLIRDIWSVGGCGFISGAPKTYKSWTAIDMAVSVSTGHPFLSEFAISEPGPVLYIQEEDSEATILRRFEQVIDGRAPEAHPHGRMGITLGSTVEWNPPQLDPQLDVSVRRGLKLDDPAWQSWLDETLSMGNYKLLIIDTLGTTAGDIDTDRANEVLGKVLSPLKQLAGKHECAIAVVHHNRKAEAGQRAGSQMLGSVALHAWVDDALYLRSKEPWRDGVRVSVERESKGALDSRFKIEVPRMGTSIREEVEGGDAYRSDGDWSWRPSIAAWLESDEPAESPSRVGVGERQRSPQARQPAAQRGSPRVAGQSTANRLKSMGGATRSVAETDIAEVMGRSLAATRKALRVAEENGLIEESGNGKWKLMSAE